MAIRMDRIWAMPNKWTFTIKPIQMLLDEEVAGEWVDPFAGYHSPATLTNDIDEKTPAQHHMDALLFLKGLEDEKYDGVIYDPPYSITQARQYGSKEYASMKYWASVKNELARIVRPGGKAVCCGWTSMGLGKSRAFTMTRILLVPHGGSKNDTICTVEVKNNGNWLGKSVPNQG